MGAHLSDNLTIPRSPHLIRTPHRDFLLEPLWLGSRGLYPLCDEDIRVIRAPIITVRTEHEVPAVWAENRETIEAFRVRDPGKPTPIYVDHVDFEISTVRIMVIRTKQNFLA